jgi:type I restriction enzyme S subunit
MTYVRRSEHLRFLPLREVAEFINGYAFAPEHWDQDGLQIIRIQNLTDPAKPFNRTTTHVPDKYRVTPGDLLVSWSASLGVFEWRGPEVGLVNQHIFRVKPNNEVVDHKYLRYALVTALDEMARHLHGATMKHVNRDEFLSTLVFLPTLAEQRRIATILDQADALRAQRRAALLQLDKVAPAIFVEMFGTGTCRDRPVPIESLGTHLSFVTSGGRGWAKFYAPSGSRFIRSLDVRMNYVATEDAVFVNPPNNAEAKRTRIKAGDVLLTITGSRIGRVAAVDSDCDGAYISQHVAILRPLESVLARYLAFYMGLPNGGQIQIENSQYGQTKPGLNFEQIKRFKIPLPSVSWQQTFVARLERLDALRKAQEIALSEHDSLFASLQHRAFRGEL